MSVCHHSSSWLPSMYVYIRRRQKSVHFCRFFVTQQNSTDWLGLCVGVSHEVCKCRRKKKEHACSHYWAETWTQRALVYRFCSLVYNHGEIRVYSVTAVDWLVAESVTQVCMSQLNPTGNQPSDTERPRLGKPQHYVLMCDRRKTNCDRIVSLE